MAKEVMRVRNITKKFPGVIALDDVSASLYEGEVLALLGENGAGKSTLVKILSGAFPHGTYSGTIEIHGAEARIKSTSDAFNSGISTIYQELMLCPELTIGENLCMGGAPRTRLGLVDWMKIYHESSQHLAAFGLGSVDPHAKLSMVSIAHQQVVEIAKAIRRNNRIIILDEPTATLSEREAEMLLDLMNKLKGQGYSLVFVSHKLDEIIRVADRAVILRDGRVVGERVIKETSVSEIIELMIGRSLTSMYPKEEAPIGEVGFAVKNLSVHNPLNPKSMLVDDVSFQVRKGEIVGLAGLIGSGQLSLLSGLFGVFPNGYVQGKILVGDREIVPGDSSELIRNGVAFISENRKEVGLVLKLSVKDNITMSVMRGMSTLGVIDPLVERRIAEEKIEELAIKTSGTMQIVSDLSGGNQQKVVLAKWLATKPRVLLLNEPTRGIDVGTKVEIYKILNRFAKAGIVVIVGSSELPELVGITDRILVMYGGRIRREFQRSEYDEQEIMHYVTGVKG